MKHTLVHLKAEQLVKEFKKNQEKGEFRNRLGRLWWPIWNRFIIPGAALCGILSLNPVGIIGGVALWSLGHQVTKGFAINVQNIAIKNAGIFGKSMKKKNISEEVRKQAIVEYLHQSGSIFFNHNYVKNNPQEINRMANGLSADGINNLVALAEYNLTRQCNHRKRQGRPLSMSERLKIYRQSYTSYAAKKCVHQNTLRSIHGYER